MRNNAADFLPVKIQNVIKGIYKQEKHETSLNTVCKDHYWTEYCMTIRPEVPTGSAQEIDLARTQTATNYVKRLISQN